MSPQWNRRDVLKGLLAASTAMIVPEHGAAEDAAPVSGPQVEIQTTPVSACTFRLSILPGNNGSVADVPGDGSLVKQSCGVPIAKLRTEPTNPISISRLRLKISVHPVNIGIANEHGDVLVAYIFPAAHGMTFGRVSGSKAAAKSADPLTWKQYRSTCARDDPALRSGEAV